MRTERFQWEGREVSRQSFDSLDDFVTFAEPGARKFFDCGDGTPRHAFTGVHSIAEAAQLAREGWTEHLSKTLEVSEAAISKVEREHTVQTFQRVIGTRGKRADIGRFAAGQPECMVSLRPTEVIKAGRVIALCASFVYSSSLSTDTVIRRGQIITALALALTKLGYAVEICADWTNDRSSDRYGSTRVLVKSAHDVTDPERILYAMAHPSMLRVIGFGAARLHEWYDDMYRRNMGSVGEPIRDLPDGTIYLPDVKSNRDVPDADEAVLGYLRELGIVQD